MKSPEAEILCLLNRARLSLTRRRRNKTLLLRITMDPVLPEAGRAPTFSGIYTEDDENCFTFLTAGDTRWTVEKKTRNLFRIMNKTTTPSSIFCNHFYIRLKNITQVVQATAAQQIIFLFCLRKKLHMKKVTSLLIID